MLMRRIIISMMRRSDRVMTYSSHYSWLVIFYNFVVTEIETDVYMTLYHH